MRILGAVDLRGRFDRLTGFFGFALGFIIAPEYPESCAAERFESEAKSALALLLLVISC